ncbi:MAG: cytochrome b/b6 domain-containing protein [bacterium]
MVKGFSRTQIALHWAVALLILYNLLLGDDMSHLWRRITQGGLTLPTTTGAWIHIIVGSLVLILVLWRLILRFTRGVPAAPEGESDMMKLAGDAGHIALYVLMIALPVTGLLAWYGGVTSLGDIHGGLLKVLLWLVIAGHVLAAFYHHFVLKDGLLNRMRKPQD